MFYLLDDYVIDPTLRDFGDMTDGELATKVCAALDDVKTLDGQSPPGGQSHGTQRWFAAQERRLTALVRDHGHSRATGYRHLDEVVTVL